jgi:hypothetical protein
VNPSAGPAFVQFPHPGTEHNPGKSNRQPWNRCDHRRKFLLSDGRYVAGDGSVCEAPLVFWGEWEAPSYIKTKWLRNGPLPRFLHVPVWEQPADSDPRQNTDPWVFGDCFRYSNCKQASQSALRRLAPGSIVLFGSGSRRDDTFVIDTVFVVGDACPFSPVEPPETDDAFRVCTIESLRTSGDAGNRFTLYRGATYEAPINGMYSFVPCRRADREKVRFSRPSVALPLCYVNPTSTQSPNGAGRPRAVAEVREQWEIVREQVLKADCLLGVHFSTPRFDHSPTEVP